MKNYKVILNGYEMIVTITSLEDHIKQLKLQSKEYTQLEELVKRLEHIYYN